MADLVISQTADRIDFRIANLNHYAVADDASPDGWGVHMDFGRDGTGVDNLQNLVDCMYQIREYNRSLGIYPAGDDPATPVGADCTNGRAIDTYIPPDILRIMLCGIPMDFEPHPSGGATITRFNEHWVCGQDAPQWFTDLADAVVKWAADNFGLTPTVT